jgi:hypothetical protein
MTFTPSTLTGVFVVGIVGMHGEVASIAGA